VDEQAPTVNTHPPRAGIVRFGAFEVDLRSGELRKGGAKIKLYGQPFNVLAILLERPGQVVTREELQQTLWAADTFVDFEHALNKAINRVREALGDDADNPRFVETLPRRGYRFIAPVTWGSNHTIIFSPLASVLQRVPDGGGPAQSVTRFNPGESLHLWPEFLPGSEAVVFEALFPPKIVIQRLAGSERRDLNESVGSNPHYASSGHLIYALGDDLMALPFDLDRLRVRGTAVPVVRGVLVPGTGGAQYDVSATGSLVYIAGSVHSAVSRLVWVSRDGAEESLAVPKGWYFGPRLSPDGRRVAFDISDDRGRQVWLYEIARDTLSQLTFEGTTNEDSTWTPDGKRLAFSSNKDGPLRVFWQLADGSSGPERLTNSHNNVAANFSWSPDGQLLSLAEVSPPGIPKIFVLRMTDRSDQPFLGSQAVEDAPQFSPDGRWLAYASNESGRREIYVKPYPGPGSKWQISTDGGTEPVWNRNGRELFYRIGNAMMAADVRTQPDFAAAKPRQLFEGNYEPTEGGLARPNYDVSADGQRFLMLKPVVEDQAAPTQINVVLNWTEELKRLVPTGK